MLARLNIPRSSASTTPARRRGLPYLVMRLVEGTTLANRIEANGACGRTRWHRSPGPRPGPRSRARLGHDPPRREAGQHPPRCRRQPPTVRLRHRPRWGPRMTRTGLVMGTSAYLAPEQLAGRDVGPSADVYSSAWCCSSASRGSGHSPGPTPRAPPPPGADPDVPDTFPGGWAPLLREMTTREAERRPTAAEVAERAGGNGSTPWAFTETAAIPVEEGTQAAGAGRAGHSQAADAAGGGPGRTPECSSPRSSSWLSPRASWPDWSPPGPAPDSRPTPTEDTQVDIRPPSRTPTTGCGR